MRRPLLRVVGILLMLTGTGRGDIRPSFPDDLPQAPRSTKPSTQQNIEIVIEDLSALKIKILPIAEVKESLTQHLLNLTVSRQKAKESTVRKWVTDLAPKWDNLHWLPMEIREFARNLHVIFNSSVLQISEAEKIIADIGILFRGAGLKADEAETLLAQLRLIVKELRLSSG